MKQWQINILHQLTFCTKMCIFSCMYTSRKTSWSKFNFEEKSKWDLTKKSQFIAWLMMKPTEFSLSIDQDVSRRLGWRKKKNKKRFNSSAPQDFSHAIRSQKKSGLWTSQVKPAVSSRAPLFPSKKLHWFQWVKTSRSGGKQSRLRFLAIKKIRPNENTGPCFSESICGPIWSEKITLLLHGAGVEESQRNRF